MAETEFFKQISNFLKSVKSGKNEVFLEFSQKRI